MSLEHFKGELETHTGNPFFWEEVLFPDIKKLIVRTCKSVQNQFDKNRNCFEVYGFDLMVDSFFQPWLLEVNLSP